MDLCYWEGVRVCVYPCVFVYGNPIQVCLLQFLCFMLSHILLWYLASSPGLGGREKAWYPLNVHALHFPYNLP